MSAPHLAVLGAGSWGTALAAQAVRAGSGVTLWGRDASHLAAIASARENARYLPGVELPSELKTEPDLDRVLAACDGVIVAAPSKAFPELLDAIAKQPGRPPVVWACKGFEAETGRLLHAVAEDRLGTTHPVGIATGPSFAREVALGLPTAITVAARDLAIARQLASWLHGGSFRTYTSDDLIGSQVGGALKNVLAIAAGISDGLQFGANARAALITRGLAELTRIGVALGGRPETLAGLTGLGDLLLTATDDQSRNRRFGLAIARGDSPEAAQRAIGQTVEGHTAAIGARQLALRLGVDAPIVEQVHSVLHAGKTPTDAVQSLLRRGSRTEAD